MHSLKGFYVLVALVVPASTWSLQAQSAPEAEPSHHPVSLRAYFQDEPEVFPFKRLQELPGQRIERDKLLHLGFSFLIVMNSNSLMRQFSDLENSVILPVSMGSSLVAGLLKELSDNFRANGSGFSVTDILADLVGIVAAAVVLVISP